MRVSQKVKGVIMRNLRDTIFYVKTNVLQNFYICISVPLKSKTYDFLFWCRLNLLEQIRRSDQSFQ